MLSEARVHGHAPLRPEAREVSVRLFKFLDVGGNDTKLVDTVAEHIGRA